MHRWAGVLLHISSLPSPFCVGDLGRSAYLFVDFLSNSRQGLWQVLPLNPTFEEFGNSPYFSTSLFAGNPLFVSPELLEEDGLISKETLDKVKEKPTQRVDYSKAYLIKDLILEEAFRNFSEDRDFWQFEEENAYWLEDYAVFSALRKKNRSSWDRWSELKPDPLDVKREKFRQYVFYRQWFRLKSYANEKGVRIIGDLPIYPAFDSADVWKNQRLFRFDVCAGVPPDYFSPEGQLWGNPVYNWQALREENFEWLVRRIKHSLKLYDLLRIDHFRGFVSYYVVPKGRQNAKEGWWERAYPEEFFSLLRDRFPEFPSIAEDLGTIDREVEELRDRFGFVSTRVLAFAFFEPNSTHLPHNYNQNCVVYTTTHDNMPLKDWFVEELNSADRKRLERYLGKSLDRENVSRELIRLAYMSVAKYCVIPMQDLLNLGKESRMNTPGTAKGNWEWRMDQLPPAELSLWLLELSEVYQRLNT